MDVSREKSIPSIFIPVSFTRLKTIFILFKVVFYIRIPYEDTTRESLYDFGTVLPITIPSCRKRGDFSSFR